MRDKDNRIAIRFGKVVRQLRSQANLSQEDFAQICQLHRTYVGAVERGEKNVTLATANKIADALNVKLSLLIQCLEDELASNGDQ